MNKNNSQFIHLLLIVLQSLGSKLFRSLTELCFPPTCLLCKADMASVQDIHLCPPCLEHFQTLQEPVCTCCGTPFQQGTGKNHFCAACLTSPPHLSWARAILRYNDKVAKLIHGLKYGGQTTAFPTFLALWQQTEWRNQLQDLDLILPVPLHPVRLQERGFNQALLLASLFFPCHKDKINPFTLKRIRNTEPQTKLSGKARRHNLKKAFWVVKKENVENKNIVLVDDVYTTGTTLNECAYVLNKAGARQVKAVTLARVADCDKKG